MKIRTIRNSFKEAVHNIFRNRVLSFASIVAIVSALFVLGAVLILAFNLEHMAGGIESKVEITVFLDKSVRQHQAQAVVNQIKGFEGIHEVEYISKDQGLAEWRNDLGDKASLLDGYEGNTNPLPDKLVLKMEKPEYAEKVIEKIRVISEVDKVNYSRELVDTIDKIARASRIVGLWFMILLVIVAMIIINNTIKITIYSRRREISIMKYVGATDGYIRRPFIIEGFTLGLFAAILAGGLVFGGYDLLLSRGGQLAGSYSFLSLFKLLPIRDLVLQIGTVFLLVGSGVGILASFFSTRKHLRV